MKNPLFKYYEPSGELKKHIRFYLDAEIKGEQFIRNPAVNYPTVFPAVNIVISEKTNDYQVGDNVYYGYRLFVGGLTRLSSKFITYNDMRLITIFFYPCGFQHIFNISISEFANCFTPLEKIDPGDAPVLQGEVMKETDDKKRIKLIDDYFHLKLSRSTWNKPDLDLAVNLVLKYKANIRVKDIAEKLQIPDRTLRRYFHNEMGMSIKEFIDLGRINFASVLLTSNPEISTQALIHELGYYDQSHFLKHLKKYIGITSSSFKELRKTFLAYYSDIETKNPLD